MPIRIFCVLFLVLSWSWSQFVVAEELDEFFEMELSELLQVTITAPGKIAQTQAQSPSVVQLITREEIRAFGANSLLEVLERATSINMLGSFFYPQNLAVIRGTQLTHSNNEVLILINGRPFRDSFTGGQNFALYTGFPIGLIKQIEIIRGPGSALYGSNGFTGVINITTEMEQIDPQISLLAGSFGTKGLSFQQGVKSGNWITNFGGRGFKEDGWTHAAIDNGGVAGAFDTGEENLSLFVNSQSTHWRVNGLYIQSQQDFWGSVSSWTGPDQATRVVESTKSLLDVGRTIEVSSQQRWEVNASHAASHFSHYNYEAKSENWLGEVTHHYTLEHGGHWLTGLTGWHQDVRTIDGLRAAPIPAFSRNWWTAYSQYQSISKDKLNWTLGLQINKIPNVSANYVPRASLNYTLDENSGFKFNYADAFRAAYAVETNFSLIVCCDAQGNNRGGLRGNSMLEPEEVSTGELQYYYQTASTQFNATLFRSRLSNLIERERAADRVLDFINRGELEVFGLELEGKYKIQAETRLSYAYTYQQNQSDDVDNFTLMPNHMLKLGLSHSFGESVKLGLFNSYYSKFHDNDIRNPNVKQVNPDAGAFNLLTANLNYRFKLLNYDAALSLYAYNLLDEAIYQPEIAGRNINTHPMKSERAWYLTLKTRF